MTEPAADIAAAKEAWQRLRNSHASFDDWLCVARALIVGRASAMQTAQTNRPVGTRYNRAMGAWLRGNDLAEICAQERYRVLLILENLPAIERWRASLSEETRRRLNHPGAIWQHWSRATKPPKPAPMGMPPEARTMPAIAERPKTTKPGAVFWDQDHLRRAHRAMVDSRSSDLLTLARVALQAAIRNSDDLYALLDNRPNPPARAMIAAPAHAPVHAVAA